MASAVSQAERMYATVLRLHEEAPTFGIDTSALPLEALMQRCLSAEQACQAAVARCEAADKQAKDLWAQKEVIRTELRALQAAEEGKGPDELRESLPAYEALGQALLIAILQTTQAYQERSAVHSEAVQPHREASAVYQEATTIYQRLIDEARAAQAQRQRELEDNARQERERADAAEQRADEEAKAKAAAEQRADEEAKAKAAAEQRADEEARAKAVAEQRADKAQQEADALRARLAAFEEAEAKRQQSNGGGGHEKTGTKDPQSAQSPETSPQPDSSQASSLPPSSTPASRPPSPGSTSPGLFGANPSFRRHYREYGPTQHVDSQLHQTSDISASPSDTPPSRTEPVAVNATDRHTTPDGP
jgi:hypothetical protein